MPVAACCRTATLLPDTQLGLTSHFEVVACCGHLVNIGLHFGWSVRVTAVFLALMKLWCLQGSVHHLPRGHSAAEDSE